MPNLNDSRWQALRDLGFTGSTNDMLVQWAQSLGASSDHINDAILEALLLNGAVTKTLTDAWYEFLISKGYTGARNDMEAQFWFDQVIPPVPPPLNVVTHNGVPVTHNGEYVTYG